MHASTAPRRLRTAFGALVLGIACVPIATRAATDADRALDAKVSALVGEISATRIQRRIEALAAFQTRHTLSETESDTRGIGAARRWIKRELEDCSKAAGGRLAVTFHDHLEPAGPRMPRAASIVNVVATLPGTDLAARERIFVVGGHYDSRASDALDASGRAPGANDDASGVAAVMEMACVMARREFDATLVFIAFAGEEQGLLGSTAWAEQAGRDGLRVEGMITNDIIGSPVGDDGQRNDRQVRLFADGFTPLLRQALTEDARAPGTAGSGQSMARSRIDTYARAWGIADLPTNQLGRHLKEAGERYVPDFEVKLIQRPDRYLRGGDHLPFLARGFAAVRFTEPAENFAHQHQDVRNEGSLQYGDLPEFVDAAYVANVARVNAAGLATLALAPAAPANPRIEVASLTNDTTLRWDANGERDLAGYRVVWREVGAPTWQQSRRVGLATRVTLTGLSKDNLIFGVQALDRDGNASMAAFPLPQRD
jgi:hypothetical protein